MENFNENIDQLFSDESKKAEENTTFSSFEKIWEKVENRLDETENKTKKRIIPVWLPYFIAASLVFTFGLIYFLNQKEEISNSSNIASNGSDELVDNQNLKNILDNTKIAKLDQSIKQNIKESHLNETSKNVNIVKTKISLPQVLVAAKISNQDNESSNINTYAEADKTKEIAINDDNQKMLAKAAPSPIVESNASIESEGIIETKKYKSAEVSRMSLNNQKTSEQLTSMAEQPSFSDYIVNNDEDFKISRKNTSEPLYIVDGYVADAKFLKNYNKRKITSLNIVEGDNAKKLYGNLAKKGVVVITTKGLNSQEEEYLKKNSRNYNLSGTNN